MDQDTVVNLTTTALHLALKLAAPLLLAGLVVGLVVSVLQAVTQIQEQTLSFIPKILAIFGILVVLGPWMLNQLVAYAGELWAGIPNLIGP